MRPLTQLFAARPRRVVPRRVTPRRLAAPAAGPVRHDPAPSRLAYRLERLWLTPAYRAAVRVGLPAAVLLLAGTLWLADEDRRAAIADRLAGIREGIENRPEFMVNLVSIEGASPVVADAVRRMLPVRLPESSFRLDLEGIRAAVADLDAVRSVDVRVKPGGVLGIEIAERVPAILWRTPQGIQMLDETGHRVATLLNRAARPDLALIAGEGADRVVPEALAVLAAAGPLTGRVRGLVRMGERRWDLVLDRDQRILLPETDPAGAVARVVALDGAEDLFNRGVTRLDLRNPDRPTIRLTAQAAAEMRGAAEAATGVKVAKR
ncbi:MAG: cell division protein FtsQ/DivIB [Rhodobacteraceae bacterium]|nr:cell division protein FtsQ/DivIB [Paracoccaceae bacterium]